MRGRKLFESEGGDWLCATALGIEHRERLRMRDVKTARRLRDERLGTLKATP